MNERIIAVLEEIRPEIDFENETDFIEKGLIDSLDVTEIICALGEEFDVELGIDEMIPENFASIVSMAGMLVSAGAQIE